MKGIGLLGAVLVLAEEGYRFERIAGTSAGAIVAALVAAYQKDGRDLHELVDVMHDLDYRRFADEPWLERVSGPLGEAVAAMVHGGSHTGDYLADWLAPLLADAGVHTFADLRIPDHGGSLQDYQRYSLVVHASDLSRRALVRLPWDYSLYGLDTLNLSATDFHISSDNQRALFDNGQSAARQFLNMLTPERRIAG